MSGHQLHQLAELLGLLESELRNPLSHQFTENPRVRETVRDTSTIVGNLLVEAHQ